ncbi:integrase, catalytic region, zinc finger, CCHC-type containing protein [Tanacetum coccineum]
MLIDSIENGPYQFLPEIIVKGADGVTDIKRKQILTDLSQEEKLRYDSDIKAVNILLLGIQSQGYTSSSGKNQALGARVVNTIGNAGANQTRVIRCYNCNSEGHIAKQCTTKKRVKDSEWFKDKMLLAQAQEAGVVLNDEQQDFLANGLEEINDCEDLQLQATTNFKADHLVQELEYIENIVSNNEAYDELTSNNNVISYAVCIVTIGNDEDNYVPPPIQNNDRILSIIEHMKTQVEKCSMVNQETQSVNESLTSDLEQYKERVKTLENKSKNYAFDREKFLDCELRTVILCDTEETLILTEESRLKMLEKQTVINTKLIDYSKLNKLYDDLVPQKQLSAEQLYWSSTPSPPESVSKPAKVFPKKLPSTGQVLKNLNNARDLLCKFDECIKRRTMLSPHR